MATKTNPTPETAAQAESTEGATPAAAASSGTVRVRWNGATKLVGIKQERTIGKHTWSYSGVGREAPVIEMDAAAWAELSPEQRKSDGFEEV